MMRSNRKSQFNTFQNNLIFLPHPRYLRQLHYYPSSTVVLPLLVMIAAIASMLTNFMIIVANDLHQLP